ADVYADLATGRAAVADGEQFQVVSGRETIRYRRDSASTQTEVARYPSAVSVQQPIWAGRLNGWLDPFFRHYTVSASSQNGRPRYHISSGAISSLEIQQG